MQAVERFEALLVELRRDVDALMGRGLAVERPAPEEPLPLSEAAELIGVSIRTVRRRLAARPELRALAPGRGAACTWPRDKLDLLREAVAERPRKGRR